MRRYLFFVSYFGTHFRGFQRQQSYILGPDRKTVQGVIELAFDHQYRGSDHIRVVGSSRTDAGVHALRSAFHTDLDISGAKQINDLEYFIKKVNKYLITEHFDVRIQSGQEVPITFNSRHDAVKRTYLYRLAVLKRDLVKPKLENTYPMSEHLRTFFIFDPEFDFDKVSEVVKLFDGVKDYKTFMGKETHQPIDKITELDVFLKISPGRPFDSEFDPCSLCFNYWNVTCSSRSFLYRQVRRIVGVLVTVGRDRLSIDDVKLMFEKPGRESWKTHVEVVPPHGLYLQNIEYRDEDLIVTDTEGDSRDEFTQQNNGKEEIIEVC